MNLGALLDPETRREMGMDDEVVDAVYAAPELSLEAVKPRFRDLIVGVDAMVARAGAMVVADASGNEAATALIADAKRLSKMIDARRDEIIKPYSGFVSSVRNFCSAFTGKMAFIDENLKEKINVYKSKVELERRKKEEAARKAKEELQARLNAEAAEANRKAEEEARQKAIAEAQAVGAGAVEIAEKVEAAVADAKAHAIEAPTVADPVIPKADGPVRAENGGTSYSVTTWVCTIVDPSLVPREFCVPVQKLLNDAVKQGAREIPGCEIKETTSIRVRC